MTVAVDTNILFDILIPDPQYKDSSLELLLYHSKTDRIIISEIVYSELASQFIDASLLNSFLHDANIQLENTSPPGLWIASQAWKKYTDNRDEKLQCSNCGSKHLITCSECGEVITGRQHIISDFIIGGHALDTAGILLSRDRGFYRRYFEGLRVKA